jgi:GNAT superfamily N-acetyltransferase
MEILRARKGDSTFLSELAFRSKSYWPYEKEALYSYRSELEVSEDDIAAGSVYIAIESGHIVGFYALSSNLEKPRLYFMFVEPSHIGKGYGKSLWYHAIYLAKLRGWSSISFYADSYASEKFYKKQGCVVIGALDSKLGPLIEMSLVLI